MSLQNLNLHWKISLVVTGVIIVVMIVLSLGMSKEQDPYLPIITKY